MTEGFGHSHDVDALRICIAEGNMSGLCTMLDAAPELLELKCGYDTYSHATPLGMAVLEGRQAIVRCLLTRYRVKPNAVCYWKHWISGTGQFLPWILATRMPNLDMAALLVRCGARTNHFYITNQRIKAPIEDDNYASLVTTMDLINRCYAAAIVLLGLRKFRHSSLLAQAPRDIVRLLARHVWSARAPQGVSRPDGPKKAKQ